MTESVSGFLSPEEREALEQRKQAQESEPVSGIWLTVLKTIADQGPTTLSELLTRVQARPRLVLSTIEDLERSGLVQVSARGTEEIAELTDAGQKMVTS
jgi:hypothetical protein